MFNTVSPLMNAIGGSRNPYDLTDHWGSRYQNNDDNKNNINKKSSKPVSQYKQLSKEQKLKKYTNRINQLTKDIKDLQAQSKIAGDKQDAIVDKLIAAKKNKSFAKKLFGDSGVGKIRRELLSVLIEVVTVDIKLAEKQIYFWDYKLSLAKLNDNKEEVKKARAEYDDWKEALSEYKNNANKLNQKAMKYKNISDKKISKDILEFQQFIDE